MTDNDHDGNCADTECKESPRQIANLFNVVESIILAMSVGLMLWVANLVVEHGKMLASHETSLKQAASRLDSLELKGSPVLSAHMLENNSELTGLRQRVDKIETAVLLLQATPGELKTIGVRLESLHEGQIRLEKAIEVSGRKP